MDVQDPHQGAVALTDNDRQTLHDLAKAVKNSVMGALSGSIFVKEPPAHAPFTYGWCKTDHKEGKEIRKDFRTEDYINDEPYAGRLRLMLKQLGLPFPKKNEVFRGTHHDLLFLNSHGVVVRIGPTDVQDLVNPGIIQPLGWVEDDVCKIKHGQKDVPFTVAIYPGIELVDDYRRDTNPNKPRIVGNLIELMRATGAGTADAGDYNCGIIRVFDDDGSEVAVKMLLDPDNKFNASLSEVKSKRDSYMKAQEQGETAAAGTARLTKGEKLYNTLRDVFNAARDVKYWERAQDLHQPLRNLFWQAFDTVNSQSDMPDADKRAAFWDKCASVTNNPVPVTLPVWRVAQQPQTTPETGPQQQTLSFVRDEIVVPHLVLYRPWTGNDNDRITKPIEQTPELKAAVKRAHDDNLHRPTAPEDVQAGHQRNWLNDSFRGRSRSPALSRERDEQDMPEKQKNPDEDVARLHDALERAGMSYMREQFSAKAKKEAEAKLHQKNKIVNAIARLGHRFLAR